MARAWLFAGGDIFIHGQLNVLYGEAALNRNWAAGCIALSDKQIEVLCRIAPIGPQVDIRP